MTRWHGRNFGELFQKNNVNKAIKLVKMGKVKSANRIIKPAINYLIKKVN